MAKWLRTLVAIPEDMSLSATESDVLFWAPQASGEHICRQQIHTH